MICFPIVTPMIFTLSALCVLSVAGGSNLYPSRPWRLERSGRFKTIRATRVIRVKRIPVQEPLPEFDGRPFWHAGSTKGTGSAGESSGFHNGQQFIRGDIQLQSPFSKKSSPGRQDLICNMVLNRLTKKSL